MVTAKDLLSPTLTDRQRERNWWKKFLWAGERFDELDRNILANREKLNRAPPWELARHFDPDLQCVIFSLERIRAFPEAWSFQLDDVLNNLRSSLDHLAWYLATRGPQPPKTERAERRVQFPIYDEPTAFESNVDQCIPGINKAQRDILKSHQPDQYESALPMSPLALLSKLNNSGKHREIRLMAVEFRQFCVDILEAKGFAVSRVERSPVLTDQAVAPGERTELVRIFGTPVGEGEPDVKVSITAEYTVALDNGIALNTALVWIGSEIIQALSQLEGTRPELA